ncbi:endonuclease/exonuclease/phosphatase family protein [Mucilaginibacter gynuensis]|uniref:Endonuclease/exonuclease/phosphatase family protein n=1 Tax=Mucilaginibacter gynuensis TaxID=1302236 RepID=A0ABP8G3U3_9SPHI
MSFRTNLLKAEKLLFYANWLAAAVLLASYLSAVISPQVFWPLAILGLGYPVLVAVNLVFVVYWMLRLKWRYSLVSGVSILLGLGILLNIIGLHFFADPNPKNEHIRLMTYNVRNFNPIDELPKGEQAHRRILHLINELQPDIIGMEEFNSRVSVFRICDSLKKTLGTDQYYFEPFIITPNDSTGLALFSKFPIVNKGVVRLSNLKNENQCIFIDVKYKNRVIRVYDFHLQSIELDYYDYYLLKNFNAQRRAGSLKIMQKLKRGFILRSMQVDIIRNHAARCPYPYVFLGDFNDTPNSYTFNQMAAGMQNTFKHKGRGLGKTFNGGFAAFQIDYILASPHFNVLSYHITPERISDHYPVYSDLQLK